MAVGFGIKSGAAAAGGALLVSLLATMIGFTVVPLAAGRELQDAARRLLAGLLSSFTLGPLLAAQVFHQWPDYLTTFINMAGNDPDMLPWAYLLAATPFIAVTGIVGFWIVAALMRFFTRRAESDLLDIARDVRNALNEEAKP